ncbi:MAG: hypothetical protein WBD99_07655 [Thermodesulfobacteriota bacterium]|jgi:aspartyl/asparaginyl beta-hydroxylase (cupin superfamily)
MSLKAIIIVLIVIGIIYFGVSKFMDSLNDVQDVSTSYLRDTIGAEKKARDVLGKSREQVKKREQMVDQE